MGWHLNDTAKTSAGILACGSNGAGPPLVLAHGWPWSSWAWSLVIPVLSQHFTVHWYDMPGFGQSLGADQRATSLDVQGEIFAEMVAHWNLERPAIWAHDFGGTVTLRARLLHGVDVGPHLLMNVVAMRPWGSAFFEHVGRHIEAFTGLPPHIHQAVVEAYVRGAIVSKLDAETVRSLTEPWQTEAGQTAFYAQFAQADEKYTTEIEPDYATLTGAVHVLWGAEDPWIPLARGTKLAKAIGCEIETMPGLGHLAQLEDPAGTGDRALAFLTQGH
ncbi:MAG: alpha/beta fold hydrolase [Paracoccaceae bacterium]